MVTAFCVMDPTTRIPLQQEALSKQARSALRSALSSDPVLRDQTRLWVQLCEQVTRSVTDRLPPSDDLIVVALYEAGLLGDATAETVSHVHGVQTALEPVRREHLSVDALLRRIAADARVFQEVWAEQTMTQRGAHPSRPSRPWRRVAPPTAWWTAAAAVVVLAIAAVFLLRAPEAHHMTVPEGFSKAVQLADGSSVLLRGPAGLSWQDDRARQVFLSGSGFFDVTSNTEPFSVTTDHAVTTVEGTEFGVESGSESTRITVVSGRVRVHAVQNRSDVVLGAGETTLIAATSDTAPDVRFAGPDPLTWTGLFIFRDTPVDSVALALERAYDVDIDVDPSLQSETLTGTFDRDQSVLDILSIVAAALGAELEQQGDQTTYRLIRRGSATG